MKINKLLFGIILVFALFLSGQIINAQVIDKATLIAQIQAQIQALMAQIQSMRAQQGIDQTWCHTFSTNLGYINSGSSEVGSLHTALQKENISYAPDSINVYSEPTGNAVIQFQAKYGIIQTGYTGILTRTKLNARYGCLTSPVLTLPPTTNPIANITINCTESNWQSFLSPSTCPSTGYQTRTWTKIGQCSGGVYHYSTEEIYCGYQVSTCTYTYFDWGACQSNGIQTRTYYASSYGCQGTPITSQSCAYLSPTCLSFSYSSWSDCINGQQSRTITSMYPPSCVGGIYVVNQSCESVVSATLCTESNWQSSVSPSTCPSTGYQTRTWTKIGQCSGGISYPSTEGVYCTYQVPACTYTYSDWGECQASGTKTRTYTSYPSDCQGTPDTSVGCTYTPPCTPAWQTGSWGTCVNSRQTRTVTDSNNCGETANEPISMRQCSAPTCPTGQILNVTIKLCFTTMACPSGSTWDPDALTCKGLPTCPPFTILETQWLNLWCSAGSMKPCMPPTAWVPNFNKCMIRSSCSSGRVWNDWMNLCTGPAVCPLGTTWNASYGCVGAPTCPAGQSLDSSTQLCVGN